MEKLKRERGSPWLVDVTGDVIKDWTPRWANTFEKLCLSMGSPCFFYFSFAHYGAMGCERERERQHRERHGRWKLERRKEKNEGEGEGVRH